MSFKPEENCYYWVESIDGPEILKFYEGLWWAAGWEVPIEQEVKILQKVVYEGDVKCP